MKKILLILISLTLLLFNGISLYAEEIYNNINVNNISKENYFLNLKDNFSQNEFGTCSYVSLENLLSYYDTFYNDDIVSEKYEVNTNNLSISPGSYNDTNEVKNIKKINSANYYLSKENSTLIGKLISIGINRFNYGLSIDAEQSINVLKSYLLTEVNMIEGVDYNINVYFNNNKDLCENWIKNEIQQGRIVITSIASTITIGGIEYEDASHSTIAYEYDSQFDEIYMHYGYHSGEINTYRAGMEIVNSSGERITYDKYNTCFSISFNGLHKHSDRYACYVGDLKHKSYCPCKYTVEANHNFEPEVNGYGKCVSCLYRTLINVSVGIITDPDSGTLCGTHVNLYDMSYRGNTLNTGLTRILYLENGSPSISRLDYDWYSDSNAKASVTKYGTVLGKLSGTVKIKAVYKNDPTEIGIITLSIFDDDITKECIIQMTTDTKTNLYENGTEVTELHEAKGLFTIHSGYTRVLCFKETNEYPTIQDFIWSSSNNEIASVSIFGTVHAKNVTEESTVLITGVNKYNNKVFARIEFTIIPNN